MIVSGTKIIGWLPGCLYRIDDKVYGSGEVEAYLAEHPEALVPEPVPPPPSAEEIERQRVAKIVEILAALDARAIRPMRAKLAGSATVADEETLSEIEAEAEALRGAL